MAIAEALGRVRGIHASEDSPPVMHTIAAEIVRASGGEVVVGGGSAVQEPGPGVFHLQPG